MPPTPAVASVDVNTVRTRFNWDWAMSSPVEDLDTYWWWARSIRVDPNEVIADDDEGGLWSIPFTTDGADEITFGTPIRVREAFVPIGEGDGVAATAVVTRRRQRVAAAALSRPAKPANPQHPRASTGPQGQEEDPMPDLTALRESLGLAEDVDDDAIIAAAAEQLAPPSEDEETEPTPASAGQVPAPPPAGQPSPQASAAELQIAAQQAVIDRLTASEEARAAREAAATREQVLSAAVQEGRISPHERTTLWEPFYDADAATATAQLASLPASRFPTTLVGDAADADDSPEASAFAARRARLTGRKES